MSTDAIVILKDDHKRIKHLFRQFEQAGENATRRKGSLMAKIIKELTVHTYIENESMYPQVIRLAPELGRTSSSRTRSTTWRMCCVWNWPRCLPPPIASMPRRRCSSRTSGITSARRNPTGSPGSGTL